MQGNRVRIEIGRPGEHHDEPVVEFKEIEGIEHAFTQHFHEELQLAFVHSGRSHAVVNNRHYAVTAGSTVCVPPYVVHSCNPEHHAAWSYTLFMIQAAWLRSVEPTGRWESSWAAAHLASTPAHVWSILPRLRDAWWLEPIQIEETLIDLCAALWDRGICDGYRCPEDRRTQARLACAEEHIRRNLVHEIPLDELSRITSLSKYHLVRSFKSAYGLPPHAYLLNLRINRARKLLGSGARVADAALDSGFWDQSHFTKVFARHVGMTPGAFRQQQYLTRSRIPHAT